MIRISHKDEHKCIKKYVSYSNFISFVDFSTHKIIKLNKVIMNDAPYLFIQ
jgi:hypothetical protein